MRLAVLNQREGGGATAQALDLVAQARDHGFDTSYQPSEADTDAAGLEARLAAFAPDVIHAHCFYNTWPPDTLARLSARWPVAFTLHDVYAVNQYGTECWECTHNAWCFGCPALSLPKRLYSIYRVRSRLERERAWRSLAAHVIYPTDWMRRRVGRTALSRLPGTVIPYGIDTEAFAPAPHAKRLLGWPAGVPMVLSVGSQYSPHDDRKGFGVLVDALALVHREVPAARLVIIGRVLDPRVREGATVIPKIEREELSAWYAAADVFTLPSLGDNAPLAVLEAMSSALPVVATTVGGIPEEVDAGKTGLLVPPRDPVSLAASLVRLLRDPALCSTFGAAGRARVLERFSRAGTWSAHEALYRSLVTARPLPGGL